MLLRLLISLLLLFLGACEAPVEETSACAPCGDLLTCNEDTGQCVVPICGNGKVEAGETCDTGADNSDTLADACRTTCVASSCGDGVPDSGEACDDQNQNDDDGCLATCACAAGYAGDSGT